MLHFICLTACCVKKSVKVWNIFIFFAKAFVISTASTVRKEKENYIYIINLKKRDYERKSVNAISLFMANCGISNGSEL